MNKKIKELNNQEDFNKVYQVFSGAPYFEKYTEENLKEIFEEYQEKGYVYGAYNDERCLGIVALERDAKKEQPVNYQNEKVMYLADIAVLDDYRKKGLGTELMLYAIMKSKELGYEKLYMRTLEAQKSMSYGIARKVGFEQIPNLYQPVERERMDGSIATLQNIFLELDLNNLDKNALKESIENVVLKREKIQKGER